MCSGCAAPIAVVWPGESSSFQKGVNRDLKEHAGSTDHDDIDTALHHRKVSSREIGGGM